MVNLNAYFSRAPGNHLTTKTRKMQMDLFRALLIQVYFSQNTAKGIVIARFQSAIPMLFSYFPLGMILVFPAVSGTRCPLSISIIDTNRSLIGPIRQRFLLHNGNISLNRCILRSLLHRSFQNCCHSTV